MIARSHRLRLLRLALLLAAWCGAAALASTAAAEQATTFRVTLAPQAAEQPVSGRLFVFLSQRGEGEPRFGPNWFAPEPFFAVDVKTLPPGGAATIDDAADGFPAKLSALEAGEYRAQALLDHDFYSHSPAQGAGNFYSDVIDVTIDPGRTEPFELLLDQTVEPREFPESERVREVVITSELLSAFHGREVIDRAAVVLPASYHAEPARRYPVIYIVPGFGGTHFGALRYAQAPPPDEEGEVEFIRVALSGDCKWGHHVYADSATNGPRGQSLIEEMIPHIDRTFRTVAAPTARFVTGHSSGGWSSLWLQVAYPDVFGGVWSTSPDPVDFRDFQQVNLYADPPENMYRDASGGRRPLARRGETPILWFDDFTRMDDVLGRGGQLRSFEAVFSPLDENGVPRRIWNRQTGKVDPEVTQAWEKYDIRLVLERDWERLGPKLRGKLHVTTGGLDTFYLEGAVVLLKESLARLGGDAEITVLPGRDHSDLLTPELFRQQRAEMAAAYRGRHADE